MNRSLPFVTEAHRLVLSGRLGEATDLIRSGTSGGSPISSSSATFSGPTIELQANPKAKPQGRSQETEEMRRARPRFPFAQPGARPPRAGKIVPAIPAGAQFLHLHHEGPFGRRAFRLYVPASPVEEPRPLVVMLHGCTQTPEDFAIGTRMNAIAEEMNLLVAYPEQDRSANATLCWNWFEPAHQRGGAGEPAILAGIVEDVARSYAVDCSRIFAAGLSAGGAMAAVLGATYPVLFAAVGVHSGLPHASADSVAAALSVMRSGRSVQGGASTSVPSIIFHGTQDRTVHPANGARAAGLGGPGDNAAETTHGTTNGRSFARTTLAPTGSAQAVEHWSIDGLAHAWSGGDETGTYADAAGPDASREMVRFFLEHPRHR